MIWIDKLNSVSVCILLILKISAPPFFPRGAFSLNEKRYKNTMKQQQPLKQNHDKK